jgi:hypothetical protein
MRFFIQVALLILVAIQFGFGQYKPQYTNNDDVRLFQTFFEDAATSDVNYGEGVLQIADYNFFNTLLIGLQGGIPVNENIEVGGRVGFLNFNPDFGDGNSGITDIALYAKHYQNAGRTQFSLGGYVTLPVGSEDVGGGDFDLGAFGALRHPISPGVTLTGQAGLNFLEAGDDRETSLQLGGGVIYQSSSQLNFVGELNLATKGDVGMLSAGVDYLTSGTGHLRGMIGFGIDNGSPDLLLQISFLSFLNR